MQQKLQNNNLEHNNDWNGHIQYILLPPEDEQVGSMSYGKCSGGLEFANSIVVYYSSCSSFIKAKTRTELKTLI